MPDLIPLLLVFAGVTGVGLIVAAWRLRRNGWNVLDPTATFWLGFAMYYGVGNIWFCVDVQSRGFYEGGGFYFDPVFASDMRALSQVAGLTVVYGLSVALGMFWLGRASLAVGVMAAGVQRLVRGPDIGTGLLIPLCVLHWITQLGIVARLGGALPSGILIIPLICCLALNLKLSYAATARPTGVSVTVAVGALVLSVICGAATGMKEAMVMPAVAAFSGLMLAVRRPWPIVAAIAVALPAFIVLQTFNKLSRAVIWDGSVNLSVIERVEALGRVTTSIVSPNATDAEFADLNRLCTAVPMVQTLQLMHRGDAISFMDGLVIPYVPRVLWPGKPQVVVGNTLYRQFTGDEDGVSSVSPGQPAEAFMYAGWLGVVSLGLGMGYLATFASVLVQHLWDLRKASSLGILILIAVSFGKCENWLWAYVPSILNCGALLFTLQLMSRLALQETPTPSTCSCLQR